MSTNQSAIATIKLWKWILLFIGSFIVLALIEGFCQFPLFFRLDQVYLSMTSIFSGILFIGLYFLWNKWFDKQWPSDLKFSNCLKYLAQGFVIAIGVFCILTSILAALGYYSIGTVCFNGIGLISNFLFFFFIACAEEVIFRGVLFNMIDKRFNTPAAVISSAFIFGFYHMMNPEATVWGAFAIAIEAGVLFSLLYKYSGSLWLPIGVHWVWNFVQGPICGYEISGAGFQEFLGKNMIIPNINGPELLTGGKFGAEASIITVIICSALSCIVYYIQKKRKAGIMC